MAVGEGEAVGAGNGVSVGDDVGVGESARVGDGSGVGDAVGKGICVTVGDGVMVNGTGVAVLTIKAITGTVSVLLSLGQRHAPGRSNPTRSVSNTRIAPMPRTRGRKTRPIRESRSGSTMGLLSPAASAVRRASSIVATSE